MLSEVCDGISHPFPNVNGASDAVWDWISNVIKHFVIDINAWPC